MSMVWSDAPQANDEIATQSRFKARFQWRRTLLASGFIAACFNPALAAAQQAEDRESEGEIAADAGERQVTRQTYDASYFARFAPQTALDMVQQIPGFSIANAPSARGLGQAAANVTINGQRVASKSNSIESQLSRINASDVVRVEIVDGASLSVPGLSGQVANVVTLNRGLTGQFEWRGEYRPELDRVLLKRGNVSVSGSSGPFTYTFAASNDASLWGFTGTSLLVDSDMRVIESQTITRHRVTDLPKAVVNLGWQAPTGASAELDLSYRLERMRDLEDEFLLLPDGQTGLRDNRDRRKKGDYEIGANVRFGLGPGQLRLIGLLQSEWGTNAGTSIVTLDASGEATGRRFITDDTISERIVRGEYDWPMWGGDWQVAGEGAFNSLHRNSTRFTLQPDGTFSEVSFPDGEVNESRYEASLSASYPIAPNIDIQATVAAELSRLSQAGSVELTRQFLRPKGSFLVSWAASEGLDISVNVQRLVGQLSFGDFLARLFVDTGDQNVGNAQLVPPQEWRVDVEANKSLGPWGQATLVLFGRKIEDRVEIIPVNGGQSPGNIPSASEYGVELDTTIELAPLGIDGARLEVGLRLVESRLDDPLTNLRRRFSRDEYREIDVSYRHDVPGTDWAYGWSFSDDVRAPNFRLTEVFDQTIRPTVGLFVEHKDVFGLNVNLGVERLFGDETFVRTRYDGFRNLGVIESVEDATRITGSEIILRIKGNF